MESRVTKICSKCGNEYPATTRYFYEDRLGKDGLRSDCKQCRRQNVKQYSRTHKVEKRLYKKKYHKTQKGFLNKVWHKMRDRCNNPKYKQYKDYGGRGIKVKFTSFEDFYNHIINTIKIDPRGLTIDRIDNDGHYEKGNIRFVSRAENNRNKNHIAQIEKQSKKKTA